MALFERQNEAAGQRAGSASDGVKPLPRFALPEVVGVPLSVEDIAEIVQQAVAETAEALGCSRLLVLSYTPREEMLRAMAAFGVETPAFRDVRLPVSGFPAAEQALRSLQTRVFTEGASHLPARLADLLHGEVMVMPLALGSRPLALLIGQFRPDAAPRSALWQQRAEEVAARASLVAELIRVASAYQDERELRQSSRNIAAAILEGHPLGEIADLIVTAVAQRLREERVALYLRDSSETYQPTKLRNVSVEYGNNISRLSRPPVAARALATGLPSYSRDVQNDPLMSEAMRELFRQEGITSVLLAMLHHGEAIKGALVVYPQEDRSFTPAEIAVFQSFADQATLAVSITQQMEQQRNLATMEERTRLAREMHDTVAQSLSAVVLQIETVQTRLEEGDAQTAAELLDAARLQARKALESTRRAVQGLTADVLERLSPVKAIEEETRQFQAEENIPAVFILTGPEQPLSEEQSLALLRIAQEALTNARKHAAPTRVRVGLQYGADSVTLIVEDDGSGFDLSARSVSEAGGYGLFGMNERARLLQGEAQIESVPGWGTRIRAILPYRPERDVLPNNREARTEAAEGKSAVSALPVGEAPYSPLDLERQAALLAARSSRSGINDREQEVLHLLAKGARNKEIAAQLFITVSTVEKHIASLFSKLSVSNRTEAVRAAIARGLVASEAPSAEHR